MRPPRIPFRHAGVWCVYNAEDACSIAAAHRGVKADERAAHVEGSATLGVWWSQIRSLSWSAAHRPGGVLRIAVVAAALLAVALSVGARASAPTTQAAQSLAGHAAPTFALPPLDGDRTGVQPVTLASERGHPVLLVFTYTLCPHCLAQTQTAAALAADERASGLRVLLVDSPAESPSIVAAYLQRARVAGGDMAVLLDLDGRAARAYHVGLYPTTVLIDGQGVVRNVWVSETSEETLRDMLRRVASETASRDAA